MNAQDREQITKELQATAESLKDLGRILNVAVFRKVSLCSKVKLAAEAINALAGTVEGINERISKEDTDEA